MSGAAFKGVEPIQLATFIKISEALREVLYNAGSTSILPIGSTGLISVMGDIDLAVAHPDGVSGLMKALEKNFEVRKMGSSTLSMKYPVGKRWVQVDMMVGNVDYLAWSRSFNPDQGIKGAARNMLLVIAIRFISKHRWPNNGIDRTRLALDFDVGLFLEKQTRQGKNKLNKEWKTIQKTFLTDDPDHIAKMLFDDISYRILTFYGLVYTIKNSKELQPYVQQIIDAFITEVTNIDRKRPGAMGDIKYITSALM